MLLLLLLPEDRVATRQKGGIKCMHLLAGQPNRSSKRRGRNNCSTCGRGDWLLRLQLQQHRDSTNNIPSTRHRSDAKAAN